MFVQRDRLPNWLIWKWPNLGSGSYMKIYIIYNISMWQDNFPPRLSFLVHSNPTLPQLPQLGPRYTASSRHICSLEAPVIQINSSDVPKPLGSIGTHHGTGIFTYMNHKNQAMVGKYRYGSYMGNNISSRRTKPSSNWYRLINDFGIFFWKGHIDMASWPLTKKHPIFLFTYWLEIVEQNRETPYQHGHGHRKIKMGF